MGMVFDRADSSTIYTRTGGVMVIKTIRPRWFGPPPVPAAAKEWETYHAVRDFALTNYVGPIDRIEVTSREREQWLTVVVAMRCYPRNVAEAGGGTDPDGLISVVSGPATCPKDDPGTVLRVIRDTIRTVVLHEIDEGLMLGNVRPWDPHRPRDFYGPEDGLT